MTHQDLLTAALRREFPDSPVSSEWAALRDEPATYSPRVDIAVGPYAIDRRYVHEYNALGRNHQLFLRNVHAEFSQNVVSLDANDFVPPLDEVCSLNGNARCFLAIEIDNSGSRKHLMGGAINAAALGRVGLSVACNPDVLKALLKTRRYLRFLAGVGKNTFDTGNLMIVTVEQLEEALRVSTARG
jgi:hypothetical protein